MYCDVFKRFNFSHRQRWKSAFVESFWTCPGFQMVSHTSLEYSHETCQQNQTRFSSTNLNHVNVFDSQPGQTLVNTAQSAFRREIKHLVNFRRVSSDLRCQVVLVSGNVFQGLLVESNQFNWLFPRIYTSVLKKLCTAAVKDRGSHFCALNIYPSECFVLFLMIWRKQTPAENLLQKPSKTLDRFPSTFVTWESWRHVYVEQKRILLRAFQGHQKNHSSRFALRSRHTAHFISRLRAAERTHTSI